MAWEHLSITRPHLVYIILGGFTSLFMLCSSIIKERLYIGEATVATLCGLIFGPHAANLINPMEWGNVDIVTIEFSRIVLVVQCFAVGVELPRFYMERHWRSVIYLLVPVMTFGWLITSLFVWWMVPRLSWLDSLVVAACVTPTDPVLASSVVGKGKFAKRVPKHLRDLLSSESGCNDGMAFPFVYLALYLISDHLDAAHTTKHWFLYTILYECIFGAILGFIIGYVARHAIRMAEERDYIDRESLLAFYFALSLFCAGIGSLLGVDDLLVGFATGVGFSNDGWFSEKTEESHVSNVIDLLLNLTYFVFLGTIVPWSDFNNAEIGLQAWRLVVIAILIIFFRRIPIMLALKPLIPDIKTWREALFAGHFGPMGVGAVFIALLARAELEHGHAVPLAKLPPPNSQNYDLIRLIWPIVTFIVISSILVHGSSIAVFALGKHINTLKLTMSYTTGDDGGKWMNRLPGLSTQTKSQMKTTSDDEDDEGMPQFPPGTLPPVGLPNNFLRRQRDEEEQSRAASRSSSRVSRRRNRSRKRDDDGPGGHVEASAIFPEKRASELSPTDTEAAAVGQSRPSASESPEQESRPGSKDAAEKPAESSDSPSVSVYEEGPRVVFEDPEGDVLGVTTTQPPAPQGGTEQAGGIPEMSEAAKKPAEKKAEEEATPVHFEWSRNYFRHKVNEVYNKEVGKRKQKAKNERKHEPAQAYQYGNTVIVEDVDGEVIKTYVLPSDKPEAHAPNLVGQGLKYISLGARKAGEASKHQGAAEGGEAKAKAAEEEAEDDKHIRFTIGGEGRRLNKEDFCREMQKLDAKTRKEVVAKSNASPAIKRLATQERAGPDIRTTAPTESSAGTPGQGTPATGGDLSTGRKVEIKKTEAKKTEAKKVEEQKAAEEDDETPAERRRREAALGITGDSEDEGEGDRRGIRFAQ